jgi:hypothetical protein
MSTQVLNIINVTRVDDLLMRERVMGFLQPG